MSRNQPSRETRMQLAQKLSEDMAYVFAGNHKNVTDGCLEFFSMLSVDHSITPDCCHLTIRVNNNEFRVELFDQNKSNPLRSNVDIYKEIFYKSYYLQLVELYQN